MSKLSLQCYLDKDGSKIMTRMINNLIRRLECMKEISDNSLDSNSNIEERAKKFEQINQICSVEMMEIDLNSLNFASTIF